jgi:hypothetical protein
LTSNIAEVEQKEAQVMISDAIINFKTVASIANHSLIVEKYDEINLRRTRIEIKEVGCEGILFGFSEFMKNFSFGMIYLAQAVLVYFFEDYEYVSQERIFTATFALLFAAFAFI